jgi:hypothetical protein
VNLPNKCASGHEWHIGEKVGIILPLTETLMKLVRDFRTSTSMKLMGFKIILELREPITKEE